MTPLDAGLWTRLRQRKLVQWGLAYLAGAWVVFQVMDGLGDRWEWATAVGRPLDVLIVVGFAATLVLAWYHGERGRQSVSGVELGMLAGLLVVGVVGVMAVSPPMAGLPETSGDDGIDPRSVVVLPFLNVSSDPEQEYFSDGLTLELIGLLGQVPGLIVQGSSSSFAFKGTSSRPDEIARQLRVATLVGGSVRRSADRLRIDAELVEAATGVRMWSNTFDEALTDQFELQERIARQIARAFQIEVGLEDASAASTSSVDAYDLYLKGRSRLLLGTPQALDDAEALFHQALDIDSEYAAAWAGIGLLITFRADLLAAPRDVLPAARDAAERALAIEDNDEARLVLGYVRMALEWNPEAGLREFDRVIEHNPNQSLAYAYRSLAQLVGQTPEALGAAMRDAETAVELEPLSPIHHWILGLVRMGARRWDEAIASERDLQAIAPGFLYIESPGAIALRVQGRFEEALAIYEAAAVVQPDEPFPGLAITYAAMGRRAEAEALLARVEARAEAPYASRAVVAAVHAALGNDDEVFEWLERGYRDGDSWLWWVPMLPTFDPYRDDPRMIELLGRIGVR